MTLVAATARSRAVHGYGRLDANFYTSPGVAAAEKVGLLEAAGLTVVGLRQVADRIWDPSRFARTYATSQEPSVPYLRPYDVFDYLPVASDRLSLSRNTSIDDLRLTPGTLLQTCSGRNLGPCALVDEPLADFTVSHDMIRIEIGDEPMRLYVLAFLQTPTGQALLRRSMSGSVIDHLTVRDVGDVPLPMPRASWPDAVATMRKVTTDIAEARRELQALLQAMSDLHPMPSPKGLRRQGWTFLSRDFSGRLDAAYHDQLVMTVRDQLLRAGGGRVDDVAAALKPPRYRRFYVDEGHGRPVLSGRQLLQVQPINLRYVSDRSFKQADDYVLTAGMTIFGGVGRAEGRLGSPALIGRHRSGWLASEDVVRLRPRGDASPGGLWLAVATPQVQLQLRALTFGSVVDHLAAEDVASVVLPPVRDELARRADKAWERVDLAEARLGQVVDQVEADLGSGSG